MDEKIFSNCYNRSFFTRSSWLCCVAFWDKNCFRKVKSYIESDSGFQEIVSEVAATNPDTLPFQTKEEAIRLLIQKVGITRLLDIKEQAQNGAINQAELLAEMESTLSEDEISALKYVLYKELNK